MINWNYNPNEYNERTFAPIPEGDHRVTITNVEEKLFNSGNGGFEITLDVAGFNSKLWYYLVFDPNDSAKTNQRIGMFFDSFAIQDHDFSHFNRWVGKDGAVRVKHNMYNGSKIANVAFCLSRSQQDKILSTPNTNQFSQATPTVIPIPKREFPGFDTF
jgi:hypothetical protein